jgi:RimJ/RimL family protein N-acetyltransferase
MTEPGDGDGEGGAAESRDRAPPSVSDPHLPMVHRLRDGTVVRLRLIGPDDREVLRHGFERLSPESRYRRFFTAMPKLPEAVLDRLSATDGWNHVAIGAERLPSAAPAAPGGARVAAEDPSDAPLPDGVGVARFVRLNDQPDVAEAAVAVVDELQGRGLGSLLLTSLMTAARLRGIAHFRAEVLPENQPMRDLLARFDPDAVIGHEAQVLVYDLALPATEDAEHPALESLRTMLRLAAQGLQVVFRKVEELVSGER